MAKTVLLQQTTFTGSEQSGVYSFYINDLLINAESITVVFDGVKYENLPVRKTLQGVELFKYGADLGNPGDPIDFSTYPFGIVSSSLKEGGPQ